MNRKTIISYTKPLLVALTGLTCIGNGLADLSPIGSEFSIATSIPGDQIKSKISIGTNGGYLVWEGNALDGNGQGISAIRLDANLEPTFEPFVVNDLRDGNQENPDMALSGENGAVFVWEGNGDIFVRVLQDGNAMGDEKLINSFTDEVQKNPAVTVMDNGKIAIVWESEDQDGDRLGVFGQIIDQEGSKIGPEFSVPQSSYLNQRSPSIASTDDGGFMVVWVSEAPVGGLGGDFGVSIWGRYFHYDGSPKGDEFQLTETNELASNPSIAMNQDGDIALVYSALPNPAFEETSLAGEANNWSVFVKVVGKDGSVTASKQLSNNVGNDQAVPVVTSNGQNFIAAWTGFGGDGVSADVYGTIFNASGEPLDAPSFLNTDKQSLQYMPSLSSTPDGNFVAVWSSFVGGTESFDLKALRFDSSHYGSGIELDIPNRPYVYGLGFNELGVTWAAVDDANFGHYEVYLNDSQNPIIADQNFLSVSDLPVDSRHTVAVRYVTSNGVKSTLSEKGEGATWTSDNNQDGLPDAFQQTFWGFNPKLWDGAQHDSDQDGLTNLEELLAGTNPLNARSVLNIGMEKTDDSYWLVWDTNPGALYQIQSTGDLKAWNSTTGPRVADGFGEKMAITASQAQNIYRVVRLK